MGIKIAIIDSGVNPAHFHVRETAGGVAFRQDNTGGIVESNGHLDELGHGTAVAGVIREKNPAADLYAIKIFHRELRASSGALLSAIKWAIEAKVDIIHLSLGSRNQAYREELKRLCLVSYENGILMVAAAQKPDDRILPASLKTVIGVYWSRECHGDQLVYHPFSCIEFGAFGQPLPLPGISQQHNFRGSSFAAARVTALAAKCICYNPAVGFEQVKHYLIERAKTEISN